MPFHLRAVYKFRIDVEPCDLQDLRPCTECRIRDEPKVEGGGAFALKKTRVDYDVAVDKKRGGLPSTFGTTYG